AGSLRLPASCSPSRWAEANMAATGGPSAALSRAPTMPMPAATSPPWRRMWRGLSRQSFGKATNMSPSGRFWFPPTRADFQPAFDHAQAIADQRQAALAGLEAKYVLQQQMISKAEADLTAKAARATFAGADAVRYRDLALTTFGTRQNAERASAADE